MAEKCNCCDWGTVNNFYPTYNTTVTNAPAQFKMRYMGDFAYRRKDTYSGTQSAKTLTSDTAPYSAQGVVWLEGGLVCFSRINQLETAPNAAVAFTVVNMANNTVVGDWVFSNKAGHHNNLIVRRYDSTAPYYEIWSACGDRISKWLYNPEENSFSYYADIMVLGDDRIGTLMYDKDADTVWWGGNQYYGIVHCDALESECTLERVFRNEMYYKFRNYYDWGAGLSQSACIHDGIIYIVWSYPDVIFMYDLTGAYIGVRSLDMFAGGYPVAENESLTWCDELGCFIMACAGRLNDPIDITGDTHIPAAYADSWQAPKYHWYHTYFYAVGDNVVTDFIPFNRTNAGRGGAALGTGRTINCVARHVADTPQPGDTTYHTGGTDHPFDFPEEASAFAWGFGERESGRVSIILSVKGDFRSYQPTLRVAGNLQVTLDHAKLCHMTVNANSEVYLLDPNYTDATGQNISYVNSIDYQVNAKSVQYLACDYLHSTNGAHLTLNGLRGAEVNCENRGSIVFFGNHYNLDQQGGHSDQVYGNIAHGIVVLDGMRTINPAGTRKLTFTNVTYNSR